MVKYRCKEEDCTKQASFGTANNKPLYCLSHKKEGMRDVVNSHCKEIGCNSRPSYNIEGESKGLYCNIHKKDGMIDVVNPRCKELNCKSRPNFNIEGERKGIYCSTHKKVGMVDVRHTKCAEPNCKTQPSYNIEGERKPLYCVSHKKEGMVNVKDNTCKESGCKIVPSYNIEGETNGIYCLSHKRDGMVNVISPRCKEIGCKRQPFYNAEGETTGLYCSTHKHKGHINVRTKRCKEVGCKIIPNYNIEGETKGLYCNLHKKEGMIDIKNPRCLTLYCETRASNKKYKGYCLRCYIHLFPDEPNTLNYKTKERAVVDFVLAAFPKTHYSWIEDKRIENGCSKKRPDLLLDLGYMIIIIEIDENQHKEYDCSCENKRLMLLSQDVGHRPIVFIRFNPDDYKTHTGNVTSCWSTNNYGICLVKKSKRKEWEERLEALRLQIDYWIQPENKTDKTLEIIHLYYNTIFDIDNESSSILHESKSDTYDVPHGGAGGIIPIKHKKI